MQSRLLLILAMLSSTSISYSGSCKIIDRECCEVSTGGENHSDSLTLILENRIRNYYRVMSDRNWEAYRNFFWPEATLTTVWQAPEDTEPRVHISTISEFIEATPEGPDSQPIFEETPVDIEVDVRGSLAIAWVSYKAKFGSEEHLMEWSGTDIFTWMKHKDEWRIVALAYSSDD